MHFTTLFVGFLALGTAAALQGFWAPYEEYLMNQNTSLVARADHSFERCSSGNHAEQKYRDRPERPNGCGTGALAGLIPGSHHFRQCCYGHDMCFGNCHVQTLHHCNYLMEKCMVDTCNSKPTVEAIACGLLIPWYKDAINSGKAAKIFPANTNKHCDCKKGPTLGPGTGISGKGYLDLRV